jgi:hypothetical protein
MLNSPLNPAEPVEEIPQDTAVHDVNGEKVGTVTHSAMRDGYFVVEKGVIFTHELYLPATAIQAREANSVSLRLSKEELKQDQWRQPPGSASAEAAQPEAPANIPAADASPMEDESFRLSAPEEVLPLTGEPTNLHSPEEEPPPASR